MQLETEERQAAQPPILALTGLTKAYAGAPALRSVSLNVAQGAIVCLLGPSGCGKTTLLRLIAGLEQPDAGTIAFAGQPLVGVPTHLRGFGLMFQDYALFPHRDVAANVAFGLRMQGLPRQQIAARVVEMLELVGLAGFGHRRVYELSGGERQRVALARSLAPSPRLLMLDEPLGALDRALRERLLDELRGILKRVGVTSIYVTHDQAEAFAIADWLVLMNAGQIEQQGPPEQVYRRPASRFAARFLGHTNLVEGRVAELAAGLLLVDTPLGRLASADAQGGLGPGDAAVLVIRPEAGVLAGAGGPNQVAGVLTERSFRGGHTRVTLQPAQGPALELDFADADLPPAGSPLAVELRPAAISVLLA